MARSSTAFILSVSSFVALSTAAACGSGSRGSEGSGGRGTGGSASGGRSASGGEGGTDAAAGGPGAGAAAGASGVEPGTESCQSAGSCGLIECSTVELAGLHVDTCSAVTPHTNPPTSGPHYPSWANFGIYEAAFPAGFLLHSLEHSAVALLYNCDLVEAGGGDCAELVAELSAFYADFPNDPLCSQPPNRLIIAPWPELDVPFAATAWAAHLKGDCFDAERVRAFVLAHYRQNYENICNPGIDPFAAACP